MQSLGEARPASGGDRTRVRPRVAVQRLSEARALERESRILEAVAAYEAAIAAADRAGAREVLAIALRRLAILRHHRDERERAAELCRRSFEVAMAIPNRILAAEALNTEGGLHLTAGALEEARDAFLKALEFGGARKLLRARVEQNLGIVANVQGRLYEALTRYERSLAAYKAAGNSHGCAIAYHNLGRVSAERGMSDSAETYYRESLARAEQSGDVYLIGQCLISQADLDFSRQRFESARQAADHALAFFGRIDARGAQSGAHRVLGMVYRETGRHELAETQLRAAIELAVGAQSVIDEADTSRELALLYQKMNRNREALLLLNTSYRLFRKLDARIDMVNVRAKLTALEATYLTVVRNWGRAIDARDSASSRRSERVAAHALRAARMLGLDEHDQTAILLGTHLHDLGMMRVPQRILRKPGPLNTEEAAQVRRHPVFGLEMLGSIELPWDIKPIIRWHHERYDGTGYPDRLSGDRIPITAQIVGLFDAYDAMVHPRPYQEKQTHDQAIQNLCLLRKRWSEPVFETFLRVVAGDDTGGG